MPDVTFSPLSNSEAESGITTTKFNQAKLAESSDSFDIDRSESEGNSSILTASFNFINSIVGAGIIGIPYAVQQCGFVSGVIMLASVACLVYQSVTMLIDCGIKANKLDFEELAEHLLGRIGYYAALVFMFLFAYGAQVAYLVVIGDTIPLVAQLFFPESLFANRNITIALMSIVIILPLCLLKDLSSLSWTSLLSIGADIALVLIVLIAAPAASSSEGIKHGEITVLNSSIFIGIGTMSFAFVCQHNSFIVFRTLKERTTKNWEKVAKGSIFFSFLMCSTLGIAGYLSFLEETKGDILNNFPETGVIVSTARLLLAFCMVFTYPMECIVTRHCLLSIINRLISDRKNAKLEGLYTAGVGSCGVCVGDESPGGFEHNPMRLGGGPYSNIVRAESDIENNIENSTDSTILIFDQNENILHGNIGEKKDAENTSPFIIKPKITPKKYGKKSLNEEKNNGRKKGENENENENESEESEDEGAASPASIRSLSSVSTSVTVSSVINERSEVDINAVKNLNKKRNLGHVEEEKKSDRIIIKLVGNNNFKSDIIGEGMKESSGEEMDDDTVYINLNNSNLSKKTNTNINTSNNNSNNNNNDKNSNFKYANYHPVSLLTPAQTPEKPQQSSLLFSRIICCCSPSSSCYRNCKKKFFPDRDVLSRVVVTLMLWSSSVVIALLFHDLGMVLALTGAVAASMLGYVLPGVLYLQTYRKEFHTAWNDAFSCEEKMDNLTNSDISSINIINHIINSKNNININNNNIILDEETNENREVNGSFSSESSTVSDGSDFNAETKNLVTGRKRRSKYQKMKSLSRFFMPIFMIIFGCLSMVIGVTSVILF